MRIVIWKFKTRNFTIVCEEEDVHFIDPFVHNGEEYEEIIAAVDHGMAIITHVSASVFRRDVEVGRGAKRYCIRPALDPSEYQLSKCGVVDVGGDVDLDRSVLRSYRREAVQRAIKDARRELAEIES